MRLREIITSPQHTLACSKRRQDRVGRSISVICKLTVSFHIPTALSLAYSFHHRFVRSRVFTCRLDIARIVWLETSRCHCLSILWMFQSLMMSKYVKKSVIDMRDRNLTKQKRSSSSPGIAPTQGNCGIYTSFLNSLPVFQISCHGVFCPTWSNSVYVNVHTNTTVANATTRMYKATLGMVKYRNRRLKQMW